MIIISMWKRLLCTLFVAAALQPLFSISAGEYNIKAGFALDSVSSEHLMVYEPTLAYEKSRFYNDGDLGTMFNLSVNFPVSYSIDGYFSPPFQLFLSFDTSFSFAVRYKALRYYIGPAFSFDALLTDGNGMRVQFGLGLYQNLGFKFEITEALGIACGAELYSNIYSADFMDPDLSGFFRGWKFKARAYFALVVNYRDDFAFGK